MRLIEELVKFIKEIEKQGKKGEAFNAIILPTNILEQFEKEINDPNNNFKDKTVFEGLEVLISSENERIRVAKIF